MIKTVCQTFNANKIKNGEELRIFNDSETYRMVGYSDDQKCILFPVQVNNSNKSALYKICKPDQIKEIVKKKPLINDMTNDEYLEILISCHGG